MLKYIPKYSNDNIIKTILLVRYLNMFEITFSVLVKPPFCELKSVGGVCHQTKNSHLERSLDHQKIP